MRACKLLILIFMLPPALQAQRRDSVSVARTQLAGGEASAADAGISLPPLPLGKALLINSFSGQQWQVENVKGLPESRILFSQYRYSPLLVVPAAAGSSFTMGLSLNFAALGAEARLNRDSEFHSEFFSFSTVSDVNPNINWSAGFAWLDRANGNRLYPLAGISYGTEDKRWKFSLGYPSVSVTYIPDEALELGIFVMRESAKYHIPDGHSLAPQGRYLEQNQSVIGLSARVLLPQGFKLSLRAGRLIDSRYNFLDGDYNENSTFKDYSDSDFLSFGLAWSPAWGTKP